MAKLRAPILALGLAGTLWALPGAAQDGDDDGDIVLDRTPERCINTNGLRSTRIVDDKTVLFYMRGGAIYQNLLADECRNLKRSGQFAYELRSSRLCSSDLITVLERFGPSLRRGITCRIDEFIPISKLEADALLNGLDDRPGDEDAGLDQFEVKPVELPDEDAGDEAEENTR